MELQFVLPETLGEWMAWITALLTLATGLWMFIQPRMWLRLMGLKTHTDRPESVAEMRGPIAGMYVGLGLIVLLLHPQPLLYLVLGACYLFVAIGRLFSMIVDKGFTGHNTLSLSIETVMAVLPLAYALGYIA